MKSFIKYFIWFIVFIIIRAAIMTPLTNENGHNVWFDPAFWVLNFMYDNFFVSEEYLEIKGMVFNVLIYLFWGAIGLLFGFFCQKRNKILILILSFFLMLPFLNYYRINHSSSSNVDETDKRISFITQRLEAIGSDESHNEEKMNLREELASLLEAKLNKTN